MNNTIKYELSLELKKVLTQYNNLSDYLNEKSNNNIKYYNIKIAYLDFDGVLWYRLTKVTINRLSKEYKQITKDDIKYYIEYINNKIQKTFEQIDILN